MIDNLGIGAMNFLVFMAYLVIAQFFWRLAANHYSDRPIGKALAALN